MFEGDAAVEPLRDGEPRELGPYHVLGRLRETASARSYLARTDDGRPLTVTAAVPELAALSAYRRRFRTEARTAGRLTGAWVQPVTDARLDTELPWTAAPFVPAQSLAEAVTRYGPLPERTVRVLGAALAETLARVHAVTGTALQGLAPHTVLIAADGPRIAAFGPLGAASRAVRAESGGLSVRLGYLTPEQLEGAQVGPPADVFVLAVLLTHAATGRAPFGESAGIAGGEPDLGGVPDALRPLLARCLTPDPAARPTPSALATELAPEGAAGAVRAGWLPGPLVDALAEQAAEVAGLVGAEHGGGPTMDAGPPPLTPRLTASSAPPLTPPPTSASAPPLTPPPTTASAPPPPAKPPTPPRRPLDRRALLTGLAAGAAGLALGGGGVAAFSTGEGREDPKAPRRLPGVAPYPRWAHELPTDAVLGAPLLHDGVLVLPAGGLRALDLRTGRTLWKVASDADESSPLLASDGTFLTFGRDALRWRSLSDGKVKLTVPHSKYSRVGDEFARVSLLARNGDAAWWHGQVAGSPERERVFAHDIARGTLLWAQPYWTPGREFTASEWAGVYRGDLLAWQADERPETAAQEARRKKRKGKAGRKPPWEPEFYARDGKTGAELWRRSFDGVDPLAGALALGPGGRLFHTAKGELRAYAVASGEELWTRDVSVAGEAEPDEHHSTPVLGARGRTLFTSCRGQAAYALDAATGEVRWESATGLSGPEVSSQAVALSASGRTLLALDSVQVTAFEAESGRRLWKFQGAGDEEGLGSSGYEAYAGKGVTVLRLGRLLYALPVA
ncbi:PQQ-binding-like beta-propeller repeat protein [Streptomyces sp. NPDC050418]|uniref:outer membrane protein assembly factor BamB family protein n=1 Tax=Streptomyces sp. NPDC050418 TaxID=3365612 RepID=UPI003790AC09